MATFAASAADTIRPFGESKVRHFPEAASQTFKRGALLIADTTGHRVKVAADAPVAGIVGVAAADASGVTGAMVPVWLAKPHLHFLVKQVAADAVDFADRGAARSMKAHATLGAQGVWVVDTATAGTDSVIVEEFLHPVTRNPLIAAGDFEAAVVVHFSNVASIYGTGT